jgi:hypothetical protein
MVVIHAAGKGGNGAAKRHRLVGGGTERIIGVGIGGDGIRRGGGAQERVVG